MQKLATALTIFILSFQLCFAEVIIRMPAQMNVHELELDQLNERLEQFKVRVAGRDEVPDCVEEQPSFPSGVNATPANRTQDPLDYFITRVQVNACSESQFNYVDDEEDNGCDPVRTPGLIDQLVEQAMTYESEGRELPPLRLDDPELRELHQEAEFLLGETRKYFYNNRISKADRQSLLINYLDSVLTRMRDLIIVKRNYINANEYDGRYFYMSLIPEFPASMIGSSDMIEVGGMPQRVTDLVSMGPNPSLEPFHLNIVDRGMGRASVEFREVDILSRDLLSLLKAPTSQNYVRGLKWMTLQMMMAQLQLYKAATGDFTPTTLPMSCRAHTNGELPSLMEVGIDPEYAAEYVEGLLFSHGLLFDNSDPMAIDYFMENIDRDPTQDGYSGLMGFENYKIANVALNGRARGPLRASLDDIEHFDTVFHMRLHQALEHFKGEIRPPRTRNRNSDNVRSVPRRILYAGVDEFNKIVSTPSEYEVFEVERQNGRVFTIDPERQNLSTFLAEAMVRAGVLDYTELISEDLSRSLESTEIKHQFPSLHGPHLWRQWALSSLSEALNAHRDVPRTHPVGRAVERVCFTVPPQLSRTLCNDRNRPVQGFADLLAEFGDVNEHLPIRRLQESDLEQIYPTLSILWDILRDQTEALPEATTNELEFLNDQMWASNPWARMRLGYLIHRDELQKARDSHEPVLVRQGRRNRLANETQCLYTRIDQRLAKLNAAARDVGINRPLSIFYADSLLSNREKQYIWQNIVEEVHEGNSQLFTERLNGKEAYDLLDNVAHKTLLSRGDVNNLLQEFPALDQQAHRELEEVLADENSQLRQDLYRLYQLRNDREAQLEIMDSILRNNGFYDSLRVKLNFLMLDSELKAPLMKHVIRQASEQRKLRIKENMEEFCNLEPDNFERFRALFYATSKSQNRINQMAGLPQVPEEILDKINSMSPDEWTNLWLGVGAGVLGIGAVLVGGACTLVTGGLCAPISAAIIAAGASAISMQLVLVGREYNMKQDANQLEAQLERMEEMGFAGPDSAYQVSRTWFWTALEAAFVIPLVGLSLRAVTVGGRMFYVSTSHTVRGSSRETFREAIRGTLSDADVRMARYKLGMDHLGNSLTVQSLVRSGPAGAEASAELTTLLIRQGVPENVVHAAFRDIDRLRTLFATGRISMDTLVTQMSRVLDPLTATLRQSTSFMERAVGTVAVRESKQVIDRRTAEVVSSYFAHNPQGLLSLVKTYTGRRMAIASTRMARVEQGTGLINRIPVARNIVNWFRKTRSESLVANADNLARLESELATVVRTGGDLQAFIHRNVDLLTDVFTNMPLRKREIPYWIMVLGGPSFGGRMAGTSIPGVSFITDGFMLRQFFNARSRLVYESFKAEARQVLRLPTNVASESTYTAYKAFQHSIADAVSTMPEQQGRQLMRELSELEAQLAQRLHQNITTLKPDGQTFRFREGSQVYRLNQEEVHRLLFNPRNLEEKALGEAVWAAAPTDSLLGLEQLSRVAHQAVQELSNYRTADQFQNYLSALKILVLKRDPAVVQYF